ncbi:MAG: hypothetical protein ABWY20_06315 [Mycobacterium sp.]
MQAVPVRYGNPVVSVREPAGRWSTAEVGGAVLTAWRAEDGVLLSDDSRRRADTHLR